MSKLLRYLASVSILLSPNLLAYQADFEVICPCEVTAISDTAMRVNFQLANQGNISNTEYVEVRVAGSDEQGGSIARLITHEVSVPVPPDVGEIKTYELILPMYRPDEATSHPYLIVSGGTHYGKYFLTDSVTPSRLSGFSFGEVVQSARVVFEVSGETINFQLPPMKNVTDRTFESVGWHIDLKDPEQGTYYELARLQLDEPLTANGESSALEFDLDISLSDFPETHRTLMVTGYADTEDGGITTLFYDELYDFSNPSGNFAFSYESTAIDFFEDSDDDGFSNYLEESLGQRNSVDTVSSTEINLTFMATTEAIQATEDIEGELDHLIAHSNNILETSGVRAKYVLKDWVDIGSQDGNRLSCDQETEETEPEKCNLWDLAKNLEEPFEEGLEIGSNGITDVMVVFAENIEGTDVCGVAASLPRHTNELPLGPFMVREKRNIVSMVHDCGAQTLTHEIGHIAGLGHNRTQTDNYPFGMTSFATGHGVEGEFATIMAYASAFGAPNVDLFSSPLKSFGGFPAGVDRAGIFSGADASFVLNQTLPRLAAISGGNPPAIELSGESVMVILTGEPAYVEPGFYASDIEDGDLTAQVEVTVTDSEGNNAQIPTDTDIQQTFFIKYSVSDSDFNRAEIIRTLVIDADSDNDGISDYRDDDRDGDGVSNELDIFPDDGSETYDSDGDGVGDNSDEAYDPVDTTYFFFGNATDTCSESEQTWLELEINGIKSRKLLPGEVLAVNLPHGNHIVRTLDKFGDATARVLAIPTQTVRVEGCDLSNFTWDDYSILYDRDADLVANAEDDYPDDRARSLMPDEDGDGYKDEYDLFPNDPNEWFDSDGDGLGNNADVIYDPEQVVDINFINRTDACSSPASLVFVFDGVSTPELNPGTKFVTPIAVGKHLLLIYRSGLLVSQQIIEIYSTTMRRGYGCDWDNYDPDSYVTITDSDGDFVPDEEDDFPTNRDEYLDTDSDGVGNNSDADDDGDGYSDVEERIAQTDPLDPSSVPEEESSGLPIWLMFWATEN